MVCSCARLRNYLDSAMISTFHTGARTVVLHTYHGRKGNKIKEKAGREARQNQCTKVQKKARLEIRIIYVK